MGNDRSDTEHSRLERERLFHDQTFEHRGRTAVKKYYKAARSSKKLYEDKILQLRNAKVLEYGCGLGSQAFQLARRHCRVTGIDISPVAIRVARDEASRQNVLDYTDFRKMNAEALEFPDNSFDAVIGSGILHHLDLEKALDEIIRVLKPEGQAFFFEPLAHNPLIRAYRALTPGLRSEDEHPLTISDINTITSRFNQTDLSWHHITAFAAGLLYKTPLFKPVSKVLNGFDFVLLNLLPPTRRWCWIVVLDLRKPVSD